MATGSKEGKEASTDEDDSELDLLKVVQARLANDHSKFSGSVDMAKKEDDLEAQTSMKCDSSEKGSIDLIKAVRTNASPGSRANDSKADSTKLSQARTPSESEIDGGVA